MWTKAEFWKLIVPSVGGILLAWWLHQPSAVILPWAFALYCAHRMEVEQAAAAAKAEALGG